MRENYNEDFREGVAHDCQILYAGKTNPCWCCGKGWDDVLEKLSYRLEALNLLSRDRWGVRIVADQVKEKYATLRFYWHCETDNSDDPTREQEVMRRYMELQAEDYVRQAERECLAHCEFCGKEIGTADSPNCWTLGWHHYLCTTCAQKKNVDGSDRLYMMDGKCYKGTTEVPNPFVKGR